MYSNPYWNGTQGGDALRALAGLSSCFGLFWLIMLVLYLWLFYRIFEKAGYSGWYTLLNLIPGFGQIIVVFMLAFGDWPSLRRQLPPTQGGPGYGGPGYGGPGYGSPGYGPDYGARQGTYPPAQQGAYPPPPAPPASAAPVPPAQPIPPAESIAPGEPMPPSEEPPA